MCLDSNLTMALYKSFTYLLTYISQVPTHHLLSAITKTRQNHCNLGVSTLQCSHLNMILFSLDPGFNGLNASNSISSGASAGFWLACKGGKGNPFFGTKWRQFFLWHLQPASFDRGTSQTVFESNKSKTQMLTLLKTVSISRFLTMRMDSDWLHKSIASIDLVTAPSSQLTLPPHFPHPAPPQTLSHGSPAPSHTFNKQWHLTSLHNDDLQHKGTMSTKPVFEKIAKIQRSYVPLCGHTIFVLLTPARTVTIISQWCKQNEHICQNYWQ